MQEQLDLYHDTFVKILGRKEYNKPLLCAICSYLGLTIYQKDTAKVACSKKAELKTVKEDFCIKKLGLEDSEELDAMIKEVCEELGSANRNKYRAVFYYLLTEKTGKAAIFLPEESKDTYNSEDPSTEEDPKILSEDEIKEKNAPTNQVILEYALMAGGAGLVPIPVLDMATITTVQYNMIKKLAEHYDHLNFDEQRTNTILAAMFAGFSSMEMGLVARLLFKGIPFVGPLLSGGTTSAYAYSATKAIGEVFDEHFAAGGSLELTDIMRKKLKDKLRGK